METTTKQFRKRNAILNYLRSTDTHPSAEMPPGSSVHGILQVWILEWVSITFSRGSSQGRDQTQVSALQADSLPSEPPGSLNGLCNVYLLGNL